MKELVAILPFRIANYKVQYLLIEELVAAWSNSLPIKCSISIEIVDGKYIQNLRDYFNKVSGYSIQPTHKILSLGTCFGDKSSPAMYRLYTVDLTGMKPTSSSACYWWDVLDSNDPIVSVMYFRLKDIIKSIIKDKR